MKQRFGIAQALLGNPRLIIVDEPTVGRDPEDRMRFHNLLSSIGENVIVILSYAFQGPPYPVSLDLIDFLKQVTPPEYQYLYDDMWQSITLYENHAKSATASRQPDGKYQVRLVVSSKKLRSDGKGQESQIAEHDFIDVGLLDKAGNYLYLQRHRIERDETELLRPFAHLNGKHTHL